MPESQEQNCIIVFSTGKPLETSESVEDLANRLNSGSKALKSVTDAKGNTHWVNIAHVVHLHERGDRSPAI